jgi:arylsulfatase A-like enzyme
MTGVHAHTHGQVNNVNEASPMAHMPSLPLVLRDSGYQTKAFGKMHFWPERACYGFERMEILPDFYRWVAQQPGAAQPKDHGIGENEMEPVFSTAEERHTVTHWVVERSVDFVETRDPTRPFLMWTSFSKPHPPWDAPRPYWDIYDGIPMPEPWIGDWSRDVEQIPQGFMAPTYVLNNVDRFSPQQLHNIRRAYYACISQVDYNLGLLFGRMRELGLLANTWIIFTADHGEMLGDHHMGAKSLYLEGAAHVPMIVKPPEGHPLSERGGKTDDRIVCLADLMPTILGMAKVNRPANWQTDGIDLLGKDRRDVLIGECAGFHAVIERDWKYIFTTDGGGELLFNLADDPHELHDRKQDAREELKRLKGMLVESLKKRRHRAVEGEELKALSKAKTRIEYQRKPWPGLHTRKDDHCDLLH